MRFLSKISYLNHTEPGAEGSSLNYTRVQFPSSPPRKNRAIKRDFYVPRGTNQGECFTGLPLGSSSIHVAQPRKV